MDVYCRIFRSNNKNFDKVRWEIGNNRLLNKLDP